MIELKGTKVTEAALLALRPHALDRQAPHLRPIPFMVFRIRFHRRAQCPRSCTLLAFLFPLGCVALSVLLFVTLLVLTLPVPVRFPPSPLVRIVLVRHVIFAG